MYAVLACLLWSVVQPPVERNAAVDRAEWGRCGHGVVGVEGKLYVIGGIDTDGAHKAVSRVDVYDVGARTWSTGAPLPTARVFAGVSELEGTIHVVGGISDADFEAKRDSSAHECYDTKTMMWKQLAPLPAARSRFPLVAAGGKLYAIGGLEMVDGGSRDSARVDVYDPATDSWSRGPDLSLGRHAHAACAIDGRILVAGGYCLKETLEPLSRCDLFDTKSGTWSAGPALGSARSWFVCVVVDGCVVALGGGDRPERLCEPFAEWKKLDVPDVNDRRFGAGVVGSEILVVGGERESGCRVLGLRARD